MDLEPGRRYTHPETCLEYEDWHAWFAGDQPLGHWRNGRILKVTEGRRKGTGSYIDPIEGTGCYTFAEYLPRYYAYLVRYFSRDGYPFAADSTR